MTNEGASMTETGLREAFAETSSDVWLVFVEIDHPMIEGGPLRFVRNGEAVRRNGQDYTALYFDIVLPGQHDRRAATANLSLPNVDRRITDVLRPVIGSTASIEVEISVALASAPDETQHGPWLTTLSHVSWSAENVSGDLLPIVDLDQSWPQVRMDNARFPGLYPG